MHNTCASSALNTHLLPCDVQHVGVVGAVAVMTSLFPIQIDQSCRVDIGRYVRTYKDLLQRAQVELTPLSTSTSHNSSHLDAGTHVLHLLFLEQ